MTNSLFSCIDDDLHKLNQLFKKKLNSKVPLVNEVIDYVAKGGKRFRPAVLLLAHRSQIGDTQSSSSINQALILALATEYIHLATLLHDDVVDDSELRRGKETAKSVFNNSASILVGDFIYSRAFELMVESDSMTAMNIFSATTNRIAEGEVRQLSQIGEVSDDVQQYFQVVEDKTASLFAAAAEVGAVIGQAPKSQQQLMSEFGRQLGIAFQITDDVLDCQGDVQKMGKSVGDDLMEGKCTLPVLLSYRQASSSERLLCEQFAANPCADGVAFMLSLIKRYDGSKLAMEYAQQAQTKAQAICDQLSSSCYVETLKHVANLAVNRSS